MRSGVEPTERGAVPAVAHDVFGDGLESAIRFVERLRAQGVTRGLIGPRELDRLWERHVLNSAVVSDLIPIGARVVDVGSGGGFPGVPIALARRDVRVTLVEPMARRVDWLQEVVEALDLPHVDVVRGRAEELLVRDAVGDADVVTARALAPLAKLVGWCLPLLRCGGVLLALKGTTAQDEVDRDRDEVRRLGGSEITVSQAGVGVLSEPTTIVAVTRSKREGAGTQRKRRRRR